MRRPDIPALRNARARDLPANTIADGCLRMFSVRRQQVNGATRRPGAAPGVS
jgi:hypothetical protein